MNCLQKDDGIIFRSADRFDWLDEFRLNCKFCRRYASRTKIAVISRALLPIFTNVTFERQAGLHQCVQQRNQLPTALGQLVFNAPGQASVIIAQYQVVLLHLAQTTHQCAAAYGMKIFKQFRRSLGTGEKIADHEHGPLVSNQLECAGNWATVDLTSSHSSTLSGI
jgi:hypothetical protein